MVHIAASGSAENLDLWYLEFSSGLLRVSGFRIGRVTCLFYVLCWADFGDDDDVVVAAA